jgi:putative ABC transport system ATP-binding protein
MTLAPLQAQGVSKTYLLGQTEVHALKQIDLEVQEKEFLALAGTSGSGKTTLLNLFGCIDRPSIGKILVDGTDVSGMGSDELAHFRSRKIGFIFQTFNLLPILSAEENVEYPLLLNHTPASERKRLVSDALGKVGLSRFADHRPDQLSGGQRQRVAIARALVKCPRIILADEPTANLDKKTAMEVLQLMKTLNQSEGVTFVFSTHDSLVLSLASRVFHMSDGQEVNSHAP